MRSLTGTMTAGVLLLVLAGSAQAGTVALAAASGRTWVDTDFDGDFSDLVGTADAASLIALSNVGQYAYRAGIEFDISGVTPSVSSALLSLVFDQVNYGNPTIELHGFGSSDGTVWSTDLTVDNLLAIIAMPPDFTWTVDVTTFVADLAAHGTPYAGFGGTQGAGTRQYLIVSRRIGSHRSAPSVPRSAPLVDHDAGAASCASTRTAVPDTIAARASGSSTTHRISDDESPHARRPSLDPSAWLPSSRTNTERSSSSHRRTTVASNRHPAVPVSVSCFDARSHWPHQTART